MGDELLSADDMCRIRSEWRAEAEDRILIAAQVLQRMHHEPIDDALMKSLMRALHSLKGTASMVGFRKVANYVHQMEDYCDMFRGRSPIPTSHLSVSLLEGALQKLERVVIGMDADHDPEPDPETMLADLRAATQDLATEKEQRFIEPELPPRPPDAIEWPVIKAINELKKEHEICTSCPFVREGYPAAPHPKLTTEDVEQQLKALNALAIEPCILLVDDEPGLTQVVSDLIKVILPRARLIEADTGSKALNLLNSVMGDQIDLVIVDLDMTDMNGLALLRTLHELRGRGEAFATSMIMTGHKPSDKDWHEGTQVGVRAFLLKPFGLEHLLTSLIGPIREAMMNRLLVSIVSHSQRVYLAFNRLEREADPQLQNGIRREIHSMLTQMGKAQRSLKDTQMLPFT